MMLFMSLEMSIPNSKIPKNMQCSVKEEVALILECDAMRRQDLEKCVPPGNGYDSESRNIARYACYLDCKCSDTYRCLASVLKLCSDPVAGP